jgi:hypothetical protein
VSKLKAIAKKIHHSEILSQEENIFCNSFRNCEKSYILTSDLQCSLDLTIYQQSGYLIEDKFEIEGRHLPPVLHPEENLPFEPDTSSEDSTTLMTLTTCGFKYPI